jgi:hypothetical protein
LIGEVKQQKSDDANYVSINPADTSLITFKNISNAYYGTFLLRPSGFESNILRNFEIGYRYSQFQTPEAAAWGGPIVMQNAFTIDYWLKWNCVVKLTYVTQTEKPNLYLAQFVYGF